MNGVHNTPHPSSCACPECRDQRRLVAKEAEIEELRAELLALRKILHGFAPLEVDLRVDGRVRSVTILARDGVPLFSVL